jgi:hypothetical protein
LYLERNMQFDENFVYDCTRFLNKKQAVKYTKIKIFKVFSVPIIRLFRNFRVSPMFHHLKF